MKLASYLSDHGMSPGELAARIGLREASISRYVTGKRIPRAEHMRAIAEATGGLVTANDFFDIAHPTPTDLPRPQVAL